MFLERIAQLGLLEHNPETNILKLFPLGVRQGIVSSVVAFLSDAGTNATAVLSSDAHVRWALECVGEGFRLPVESAGVVTACVELYGRWLRDEHARPAALTARYEAYTVAMLEQLTLLFAPRARTREEVAVQGELCRKALGIFMGVARQPLSRPAWERVLKLLLGLTDTIIGAAGAGTTGVSSVSSAAGATTSTATSASATSTGTSASSVSTTAEDHALGRLLAERVMHDLYEAWLLSECRDDGLWTSFKLMNRGWLGVPEVTAQWNATVLGLTTHVLQALYLPAERQAVLHIAVSPLHATFLDVRPAYARYAWLRFLYLLGGANSVAAPAVHTQVMAGVAACVDACLAVVANGCADGPDGNTVMHLFGRDLLEALYAARPGFEEGTAVAVRTLCRVVAVCAHSVWAPQYLAALYAALRCGLAAPTDGRVLAETLVHAQHLLAADLPGARVLVPAFVRALERVFNAPAKDHIRPACTTILSSLLCLANRFQTAPLPQDPALPDSFLPPIATYYDLEPHIGYLLSLALTTEKNPASTKSLLWLSYVFLLEFLPSIRSPCGGVLSPAAGATATTGASAGAMGTNATAATTTGATTPTDQSFFLCAPKFAWTFLRTVLNQLGTAEWSTDVMCVAVDVLAAMVQLSPHLEGRERFADAVVTRLCALVAERGASALRADEALVAGALRCVTQWVMLGLWAANDRRAVTLVVETCLALVQAGSPNGNGASAGASGMGGNNVSGSSSASGSIGTGDGTISSGVTSNSGNSPNSSSISGSSNSGMSGNGTGSGSSLTGAQTGSGSNSSGSGNGTNGNNGTPSKTVVNAAYQCLLTIVNEWAVFPSNAGAERVSSLVNEEFLLRRMVAAGGLTAAETSQYIRYYALDDSRILTVLDVPALAETQGFSTVLIIRDRAGKHVWRAALREAPSSASGAPAGASSPSSALGTEGGETLPQCVTPFASRLLPFSEAPAATLAPVYTYLDVLGTGDLETAVADAVAAERVMLDRNQHGLSVSVAVSPPTRRPKLEEEEEEGAHADETHAEACRCLGGRVLLAHLGLLRPRARQLLQPLAPTASFLSGLRQLDQQPERDCMTFGVVLQRAGQELEEEVYANQAAPADFAEFVASLGWPVRLATHTGFMGGLSRRGAHGESAPYYADCLTEVVYHVAPLMPHSETNTHKKRLISKDFVLIVWSEDGSYDENTLDSHDNHLKIIIHPLASRLYHVRTLGDDKVAPACCGPLQSSMILSKYVLGPLVRMTAVNAYRAVQAAFDWMFPFAIRQRILTDIVRRNVADTRPAAFFSNILLSPRDGKPGAGEALLAMASAAPTQQQQQQQQPQPQQQQAPAATAHQRVNSAYRPPPVAAAGTAAHPFQRPGVAPGAQTTPTTVQGGGAAPAPAAGRPKTPPAMHAPAAPTAQQPAAAAFAPPAALPPMPMMSAGSAAAPPLQLPGAAAAAPVAPAAAAPPQTLPMMPMRPSGTGAGTGSSSSPPPRLPTNLARIPPQLPPGATAAGAPSPRFQSSASSFRTVGAGPRIGGLRPAPPAPNGAPPPGPAPQRPPAQPHPPVSSPGTGGSVQRWVSFDPRKC